MSIQAVHQGTFSFLQNLPVVIEATAARLSSDAGLLAIREFDERIGLTRNFAVGLNDPRDPKKFDHSFLDMSRARIYGVLADYVDQNDHDTLRSDPVFKMIADRLPDGPDLASQPTLSRFENAIDIASLKRLRQQFVDQFIASFAAPPRRLTFDLDAVDDPTHGAQQLSLFHGYFEQYQYFPSFITSADNDQVVVLSLRPGTVHAALGADDDLRYLVERLRQVWPDLVICVRGDAGYGMPWMYAVCEELGVEYLFGLAANKKLQKASETLLAEAVRKFEQTKTPLRGLLVSGPVLATCPLGHRQGRGQRPRHQSPLHRHQSPRRLGGAGRRLRRLCRAWREREPQQGTQVRLANRPHQRSPFPGELLSPLSAHRRVQPAGTLPASDGFAARACTRTGRAAPSVTGCRAAAAFSALPAA
jgi:Transposase DDE domain group 1